MFCFTPEVANLGVCSVSLTLNTSILATVPEALPATLQSSAAVAAGVPLSPPAVHVCPRASRSF